MISLNMIYIYLFLPLGDSWPQILNISISYLLSGFYIFLFSLLELRSDFSQLPVVDIYIYMRLKLFWNLFYGTVKVIFQLPIYCQDSYFLSSLHEIRLFSFICTHYYIFSIIYIYTKCTWFKNYFETYFMLP